MKTYYASWGIGAERVGGKIVYKGDLFLSPTDPPQDDREDENGDFISNQFFLGSDGHNNEFESYEAIEQHFINKCKEKGWKISNSTLKTGYKYVAYTKSSIPSSARDSG